MTANDANALDVARRARSIAKEVYEQAWQHSAHLGAPRAAIGLITLDDALIAALEARVRELEAALDAVESIVDTEFPPWMTDYARALNSTQFKAAYENGWGNGVHWVQQQILIALGIKPAASTPADFPHADLDRIAAGDGPDVRA